MHGFLEPTTHKYYGTCRSFPPYGKPLISVSNFIFEGNTETVLYFAARWKPTHLAAFSESPLKLFYILVGCVVLVILKVIKKQLLYSTPNYDT